MILLRACRASPGLKGARMKKIGLLFLVVLTIGGIAKASVTLADYVRGVLVPNGDKQGHFLDGSPCNVWLIDNGYLEAILRKGTGTSEGDVTIFHFVPTAPQKLFWPNFGQWTIVQGSESFSYAAKKRALTINKVTCILN